MKLHKKISAWMYKKLGRRNNDSTNTNHGGTLNHTSPSLTHVRSTVLGIISLR